MPRLLGVEIPGDKRVEASLVYIYGIGPKTAKRILEQANINPDIRAKELSPEQIGGIISAISGQGVVIEGDLRREIQGNLKRLQLLSWRSPSPRTSCPRTAHPDQCPHT